MNKKANVPFLTVKRCSWLLLYVGMIIAFTSDVRANPTSPAGLADLKVVELKYDYTTKVITYKVRNVGKAPASAHTNSLYVAGTKLTHEKIDKIILPDESYEGSFNDYQFQCGTFSSKVEIRIDDDDSVTESNESNNSQRANFSTLWYLTDFVAGNLSMILIPLLLLTGLIILVRLKVVQLFRFGHSFKVVSGVYDNPDDTGDVTHFQALATALSATVGIGNIAGVAIALRLGGPGALFWMWVTAVLGMGLKFAECTLAHRYRHIHKDGSASGGPMYYITKGLGKHFGFLAIFFAVCATLCSFCTGNMNQANTIAASLEEFGIPVWVTGVAIATLVGLVIIGGIKRIAGVASRIVPVMAIIYCGGVLVILALHYNNIFESFLSIFTGAFSLKAGFWGGFVTTMMWGIRRGLYSNEAGQGSAAMAHAAAKTEESIREGVVAMMGPFIDTIVICSMTGIAIICTGVLGSAPDLTGVSLTRMAFEAGFSFYPQIGTFIVTVSVFFFAYSTMVSWSYYGDRACEYILGKRAIRPYRWVYVFFVFMGSVLPLAAVWNIGDIALTMMAIPNLIAIILLSGKLKQMSKEYFSKTHLTYKQQLAANDE